MEPVGNKGEMGRSWGLRLVIANGGDLARFAPHSGVLGFWLLSTMALLILYHSSYCVQVFVLIDKSSLSNLF